MQSPTPSVSLNDSSYTLYKRMRREKKGDSNPQQVGGESVNAAVAATDLKALH